MKTHCLDFREPTLGTFKLTAYGLDLGVRESWSARPWTVRPTACDIIPGTQ